MPSHIALQRRFLATVPVGGSARRWRRRRHRTCVLRACVQRRARWRGPRDDTVTTVSSTSSFCRRRLLRRRLLGRQAAGRGTTFGAGCAVRRAASAPSPPHLHSTRRHSAPSVGRCTGTSWPDLGVRAQLLRSARASRRAAKGTRAQVDGQWRDGWEPLRPPTRLEPAAAGRRRAEQGLRSDAGKKYVGRTHGRIKGGQSQYRVP